MGSGFGEGDNRAQEAAQEAISSPLLDDVSIGGAQGVLINITGGMDLAIDEVTQISSIIQEEAGDEAEIIFGAVHDPQLEGQVRVTVIATGFDTQESDMLRPDFRRPATTQRQQEQRQQGARSRTGSPTPMPPVEQEQLQVEMQKQVAVGGGSPIQVDPVTPLGRMPSRPVSAQEIGELDIPTFIRRQMD